jgi:hypothetical protein
VVSVEHALAVAEGLLEEGDGGVEVASGLVGAGEVVATGQGVGMIGAEDAFVVVLVAVLSRGPCR